MYAPWGQQSQACPYGLLFISVRNLTCQKVDADPNKYACLQDLLFYFSLLFSSAVYITQYISSLYAVYSAGNVERRLHTITVPLLQI